VYRFEGSQGGTVCLSFNREDWIRPNTVLIVPFYQGQIVFAKHEKRGWELPGGTIEAGEFPIQAAIRELFEETGAEAEALEQVGQYILDHPAREEPMVKSIFVARVSKLHTLPTGFETTEIRCLPDFPEWQAICENASYSFIMKDRVYLYIVEHVKHHPYRS
jgi:8-oxo-dGTP diphosphatase